MGLEILGLLAASAGASYGWWRLQQRRTRTYGIEDVPRDPDLEVVLGVAMHEAQTRRHTHLWPLHLLHGLVQDQTFVAAIGRLRGDATAMEAHVQDVLDKHHAEYDEPATREGAVVYTRMLLTAKMTSRAATTTDLWGHLVHTDAGKAAAAAAKIDPTALLFLLAHGMPEPELDLQDRTDVHVVLRNDDFTTQELVVEILRDVFGLPEHEAQERMLQTHREGKTIVGRYKLALVRDRIEAGRRRAREHGSPLWIAVEDC